MALRIETVNDTGDAKTDAPASISSRSSTEPGRSGVNFPPEAAKVPAVTLTPA